MTSRNDSVNVAWNVPASAPDMYRHSFDLEDYCNERLTTAAAERQSGEAVADAFSAVPARAAYADRWSQWSA
jgi:hypothetical protein